MLSYRMLQSRFESKFVIAFLLIALVPLYIGVLASNVRAQEASPINSSPAASPAAPTHAASQPAGSAASGTTKDVTKAAAKVGPGGEDFTTPRIPAGLLPAPDAVELGKAEYPGFTRELQEVQWRDGDLIDVWVMKPTGVEKPPVILYLYSYPTDTDTFQSPQVEGFLTKNGFAAVGFVSALTGQRYHDIPQKEWFVSQLQSSLAITAHDVQLMLNYLSSRGDLDMTRVGMFGQGSGASIAIMAAAVDPRIKVLDLLDPWGDWPDWLAKSPIIPENERPSYVKPEFLSEVENLDPVKWLPELQTPQVRLQYVDSLKITPDVAKERILAAASSNPRIKIVHYKDDEAFRAEVTSKGMAYDWIKGQLRTTVAEQGRSSQAVPADAQSVKKADQ